MSALGVDPAPGDPATVRAVAARLRQRAGSLRAEADALAPPGRGPWEGAAAASFTALATTLPEDLRRSAEAADLAVAALEAYAGSLAAARAVVPGLSARAEDVSARLARAALAPVDPFGTAGPAVAEEERQRGDALRELSALRREAERLRGTVEEAGRSAARVLDDARDLLPDRPPLLARAAASVDGAADATWERVEAFAAEHAEEIQLVADVAAVVGLAATIGAVVCPPLAALAGGTRLVRLAAAGARAASVGGRTAVWAGSAANGGLVAGTGRTVADLWPDALAIGTLGASRALTAPARSLRGAPVRWNIATARAADAQAPAMSGWSRPSTWTAPLPGATGVTPSIWAHGAGMGSNELVMRSVRFAVDAPNAVVGAVGGGLAARDLARRSGGRPSAPTRRTSGPPAAGARRERVAE